MADPPPFPFSDLHFNGTLTSLVPKVVVGNDVWPSDVDDVSEASVLLCYVYLKYLFPLCQWHACKLACA